MRGDAVKSSLIRTNSDRMVAAVLVGLGVVALVIGWFGISGKPLAAEQLPYLISGGLGGLVLVAVGCALGLSADLQDEWRQLERIEERLDELVADKAVAEAAPSTNGARRSPRRAKA
jgi:hypothetical protein